MRLARTKIQNLSKNSNHWVNRAKIQNPKTSGLTNHSATWPVVMSQNVRNYLAQGGKPAKATSQQKFSTTNESDGIRFSCSTAKEYCQMVKR